LTTDKQKNVEYEVKVLSVKDAAGNEVLAASSATTEPKRASGVEDLVPPEEVTKLIARIKNANTNLVELSWKASKNSAGDLDDQLLYQSPDREGKEYGQATNLGTSTTIVEVEDLEANSWHTFKVTTKDTNGNESTGAFVSIFLPETGPEVALIAAFALTAAYWRKRRKAKG
jgi:hypothetical protein